MTNFKELVNMDLQELRALRMVIDKVIETKTMASLNELRIGDHVKINHKKVLGMTFSVTKINRKKIQVRSLKGNKTYNVAMSLVEKA